MLWNCGNLWILNPFAVNFVAEEVALSEELQDKLLKFLKIKVSNFDIKKQILLHSVFILYCRKTKKELVSWRTPNKIFSKIRLWAEKGWEALW